MSRAIVPILIFLFFFFDGLLTSLLSARFSFLGEVKELSLRVGISGMFFWLRFTCLSAVDCWILVGFGVISGIPWVTARLICAEGVGYFEVNSCWGGFWSEVMSGG